MAPVISSSHTLMRRMAEVTKPTNPNTLIVEAWAQGFMVGSILIMLCTTVSNYRRGVLLHKVILLELVFGSFHGTFIFNDAPVYGWYLSVTAIFLIISWNLHNVIAWIKVRPFIGRKTSLIFIGTIALVQPYWVLEIYADFTYFNNINDIYLKTRVVEALFRDPWWVYTTCCLLYNIRTRYNFGLFELMRFSPRFAVMLIAMILSLIFTIIDICAVTGRLSASIPIGINPFWKLAFVFKLLTDSVILDDFKTALDKLSARNISRIEVQWARDWATAKPAVEHRERPLTFRRSSPNETKISGGVSEQSDLLEHGPGIAVKREIKVNHHSARKAEVAIPLKCLNK
ncbi:hypothetical protein BKA61DRAFT_622631 [Leptodontidium sp. MPI-SDFR-AT-0119]|nr:hypothetical protein BKA61DRAFT_622631 [Leptodontidium sp. MPI-SDFR-AT-0119]